MVVGRFEKGLFWFIVGINFLNYLDRYTLPAVLEPLGRDLGLSDGERGWLGSAFLLSYTIAAPLFGFLGDRFSRPRLISGAIALWSLATAATFFVRTYGELLALRSLVGVGEAAYYGLGVAMLCDLVPERERAGKLTYFFLAIPLGSAVGFGISGMIAEALSWRAAFLVCGLPGLVAAAFIWFARDPERGANDLVPDAIRSLSFARRMRFLFTHRIWLATTACYVGYTFAMGALTHWSASFLERAHGVGTGSSGLLFGAMAAFTGIVGTLLGGRLSQRLAGRRPHFDIHFSSATLCLSALGIAGYLLAPNLVVSLACLFVAMLLLFANTTPVNNLTVSHLPASIRALGASMNVFFIHILGDALSPKLVGDLSDRGGATAASLGNALLITLPALVLAGLVLLFAKRRKETPAA